MLRRKSFCAVLFLVFSLLILTMPAAALDIPDDILQLFGMEDTGFHYVHDPALNPSAMKDIIADPAAVYGFRPDPDSARLGVYAGYDWTDAAFVAESRQARVEYHESMEELYALEEKLVGEGADTETVARAVSALRNELRLRAYDGDPEGLEAVKASNLAAYGDENGPTADSLYEKYGSWGTVLEKAFSVNSGMDACLGLYDDYYGLYCVTGQVDDPEYLYEQRLLSMLEYFTDDLMAYIENPGLPCTRGHAVTLLWVLSACPQPQDAAAETFSDIPHSSVYYLPVQWAKEAGVACGTPGSVFAPDMLLTRAQMVMFLMRLTAPADYTAQTENSFTDVPEDAYYREAVLWALENGITYGTSETTFSPDKECTFMETALFLYRWMELVTGMSFDDMLPALAA